MKRYIGKNILNKPIELVVIGTSAGGLNVLKDLISNLSDDYEVPIVIVQHLSPFSDNYNVKILNSLTKLKVKEVECNEKLKKGYIYLAPPNYHVLVELNRTLTLSVEAKVNYSRPAVDVLFDTAADSIGGSVVGIILTGGNNDGALGLKKIKEKGGVAIVQKNPEVPSMPKAAKRIVDIDYELTIREMTILLNHIGGCYDFKGKD